MHVSPYVADALKGVVLVLAALAAMTPLRRSPAALRHFVLALALGALLVLPAASAIAPAWRVASLAALDAAPAPEPMVDPALVPVGAVAGATGGAVDPSHARRGAARGHDWSIARVASRVGWRELLALVWAAGALLVLARLGVGLAGARRLVRGAQPVPERRALIEAVAREIGLARADVRMGDTVEMPAVVGLFAPVVLLPLAAQTWDDGRWRVVLLHELAHVKRRDCATQLVAQLACALHWFNPLAWMAARRMRRERELAADDCVLAAGARASGYAEHLVAIAADVIEPGLPSGALAMAEPSELAVRVTALLAPRRAGSRVSRAKKLAAIGVAWGALAAVACATGEGPRGAPRASDVKVVVKTEPADLSLRAKREASVGEPAPGGGDTRDPALQAIVDEELDRVVAEWRSESGSVVVIEPSTGAVLAMASRSAQPGVEVAFQAARSPASTTKAFLVAAALEEGTIHLGDRFDCGGGERHYGERVLHDPNPYRVLDVPQILATSSNVGASKIFDTLGGARLGKWLHRFHFGERPDLGPNAASGTVPATIGDGLPGAVVAMGEGLTASPLQVAAGYAAIANGGVYNAPSLVKRAPSAERVLRAETARDVMAALEESVRGELATGKAARIPGTRVAGKTGTVAVRDPAGKIVEGRNYATFVGIVPANAPRFVILVGVEASSTGPKVAAPAFARIATRALASR